MSENGINLHGIAAEIEKVQEQLRAAKLQAAPSDIEYLDLKIAELQDLHVATHKLCPKSWGVWGEPASIAVAPSGPQPPRATRAD